MPWKRWFSQVVREVGETYRHAKENNPHLIDYKDVNPLT